MNETFLGSPPEIILLSVCSALVSNALRASRSEGVNIFVQNFHEVFRLLLVDLLLRAENHAMGLKSIISIILSSYHWK